MQAALEPTGGAFHSRWLLVWIVICHVLVGAALFRVLDRLRPTLPPPITIALIAEPPPVEEEVAEIPPQPLPQAPEPPPRRLEPPKAAELPQPVPEPPPAPAEPVHEPEPPPPPVQRAEPRLEPEPRPEPAPPVVLAPPAVPEPSVAAAPAPPEPVRPPAVSRPPVLQPPPPVAARAEPVSEPLYGADYLRNPKPVYPLMSRRMGEQGVVLLRVFVTAEGDPREVELKEGSGFSRLDRAAQDVVKRWKFVPAKRGAQPVDAWVVVPIRFSLKG